MEDTTATQRSANRFMWLVIAAGAAVCLFSAYQFPRQSLVRLDLSFLFVVIVTGAIGSRVAVEIPRIGGQITVSDTFIFLTMLLYGGEAAIFLATLDGICTSIRISRKLRTYLFNSAVLTCSAFLTVWTLRLCFGPIIELPQHDITGAFITAICVMALVQYAANSGLIAAAQSIKMGRPFWETWSKYYLWSSVTYFAGASAAGIIAKLVSSFGFYAVVVTAPIITIVYFTYSTYLKNIEASARQAELAQKHVDELSRYITEQERIREQFAQMEKLSALGELASGVAHDFNNTLAGILGRAQLLLMRTHDPEVVRSLRIIVKSAQDGAHTVKRIQDFARQRRDKNFEPIAIDQLLLEIIEMTRPRWKNSAEANNVQIRFESRISTNAFIMADESELREVLVNMIFNAVDAMPEGGLIVLAAEEAGSSVSISISDTGQGMSEEVRSRIFDPFFTTKGKAGLGLGLAVSYGIVSRHEGTIDVESEVGRGTTFCITLPKGEAESIARQGALESAELPAPIQLPSHTQKLRILVVDDEAPLRDIIGEMLEREGHEVRLAESGRQALELFDAESFDAVFTDIGMPGMNGWELARSIRARDGHVPLAVITGWGNAVGTQEQNDAGVNWVVTKPFTAARISELAHEVSRHLYEAAEDAETAAA
jgi:signal transduction histidine kinase/ActR/RegA family two-component response regulator